MVVGLQRAKVLD